VTKKTRPDWSGMSLEGSKGAFDVMAEGVADRGDLSCELGCGFGTNGVLQRAQYATFELW
jgi:hypothetical protein